MQRNTGDGYSNKIFFEIIALLRGAVISFLCYTSFAFVFNKRSKCDKYHDKSKQCFVCNHL